MTLSPSEQQAISQDYSNEEHVQNKVTANVTVSEIITEALNLDSFITSNLTAINNQFSQSFRDKTTISQRLKLFKLVVARLELQ